jgi:small subunit ribosomal protein S17|tara:strand:+ start:38 stop:475 length:438 start_codon:yes stop_codon:yes gene_type:complete
MEANNIGIKVAKPKEKCKDNNCPFHGSLRCRGRIFTGTVISVKMQKTASVWWERRNFLRKYERYEKRKSGVKAHNPSCINAQEGNIVKIMECRPLSKTKSFVIIEVSGKERGFKERMEAEEESKVKREAKKIDEQTDKAEEEVAK